MEEAVGHNINHDMSHHPILLTISPRRKNDRCLLQRAPVEEAKEVGCSAQTPAPLPPTPDAHKSHSQSSKNNTSASLQQKKKHQRLNIRSLSTINTINSKSYSSSRPVRLHGRAQACKWLGSPSTWGSFDSGD